MVTVRRSNTILYVDRWSDTVEFYRHALGLPVEFENDWFVEFAAGPDAFVSVADARRTSIAPALGAGITLSLQVDDVRRVRSELIAAEIDIAHVGVRWDADVIDVHDPAGNRVEFWSRRTTADDEGVNDDRS